MLELAKLIDLIVGFAAPVVHSQVQSKLQRSEWVIKLLKQLKLDPNHPPADFAGVYQYALVEYGVGKPRPCLEIFRQPEIQGIFRQALEQNNPALWLKAGEDWLERAPLQSQIQALGLDPKRELAAFAAVFIEVAKRTRTPAEVLSTHQLASLHRQVGEVLDRIERLPTLEGVRTEMARLAAQDVFSSGLPAGQSQPGSQSFALAQRLRGWFETLGYRFETLDRWEENYFEWVINIPVRRGKYDRVLIRGMNGEAGLRDIQALRQSVAAQRTDEGWLVTTRRISRVARDLVEQAENHDLGCYTFDELLDQDADFSGYLDGLAAEIAKRQIEQRYVPLACTKEEIDPETQQRLGVSRYGDRDGYIEGYIDQWLDDPAKEHISVLGEFGTGKTWFALHYAARALHRYRDAQRRGVERPRLPLVIPLRDYAKAVSVESLFSEFFFRKYEIPIPGYSAFEQLNRMGKLLLIFDGFDEMAARVDRQEMINNFWELAKVVVPGAKVILTCRTEHFPEAREGRALLNAELQASTRDLTGETPQFEVLELEKFDDAQIRQVLSLQASEATVEQVLSNAQLVDLARRPVMTELILEALPDIEAGKPVDMSRVYLYAVRRKMERDIKAERTFTSMADKLYFLCELSWEMLSSDRMSLNYREFPDRLRKLFGAAVQEQKDLDHWHYDMMGQTMLIRNAAGDYTPAHRSLLEFFVAYKFAAELGALAPDFLELAQMQTHVDASLEPREYHWSEYFGQRGGRFAPLREFVSENLEVLRSGFGHTLLPKAVIDLILPILNIAEKGNSCLRKTLDITRGKSVSETKYVGGNAATLLVAIDSAALENRDLSYTVIQGANFTTASLRNTNLSNANMTDSIFIETFGLVLSLALSSDDQIVATGGADGEISLWQLADGRKKFSFRAHPDWISALAFTFDNAILASSGHEGKVKLWRVQTGQCLKTLEGHTGQIRSISLNPDGTILVSGSDDQTIRVWDVGTGECLMTLAGHTDRIWSIAISPDSKIIASGSFDQTIKLWDINTGECLKTLQNNSYLLSVAFSYNGQILASGGGDSVVKIWNVNTGICINRLEGHARSVRTVAFSRNDAILSSGGSDQTIKFWDIRSGECLNTVNAHNGRVRTLSFNSKNTVFISSSDDQTVKIWDLSTAECLKTLYGGSRWVDSVAFHPNGKSIVISSNDKSVKVLDIDSGEHLRIFKGHDRWISSISISSDGEIVASGGGDGTVRIWNISTGQCLRILHGHMNRITEVVFSLNGYFLVSSSDDGTIKLWNVLTGDCLKTIAIARQYKYSTSSISLSPNGTAVAVSIGDYAENSYTIRLLDIESEEILNVFHGHGDRIWSLSMSPDGRRLASGCRDQTGRIWDVETGECLQTLQGHTEGIDSVSFSHNSNLLLTSSMDQLIKLWDVESGEYLRTFTGHTGRVRSVAFSPDDKTLVSGSYDETVKLWDVASGKCLKTFSNKPYDGMNITGVKGLDAAAISTLKALGAVEDE